MYKISERNANGFDHLSIYRWHASTTCKWALSLVFPSIRSLWFWRVCICSVCSLISLFLIFAVCKWGSVLHSRVSKTPLLIHSLLVPTCPSISFFPQALSFICLSSADSLHPSLQPRPSLWSSLFRFLPHPITSGSVSLVPSSAVLSTPLISPLVCPLLTYFTRHSFCPSSALGPLHLIFVSF